MIFIETPIFTRRVKELMDDDDFAVLQKILVCNPSAGEVMEATGGDPKDSYRSQRPWQTGGARVIYYHFVHASRIALLMIYPKNEQQDLTVDQRKALKLIVEHWR